MPNEQPIAMTKAEAYRVYLDYWKACERIHDASQSLQGRATDTEMIQTVSRAKQQRQGPENGR